MKLHSFPQPRLRRLLATVAALLAVAALSVPAPAAADTQVAHLKDKSGTTTATYTSVADAVNAGYDASAAGGSIVMDSDWDLGSSRIEVAGGKTLSIDMNGHKITSTNSGRTIYVNDGATLKLTSSAQPRSFDYRGFDANKECWSDFSISASGLVTNDYVNNKKSVGGGGIHSGENCRLVLENVAVAGCGAAGIFADDGTALELSYVTVSHCRAPTVITGDSGGGVYLRSNCNMTMVASHIDDNYGVLYGGGVYSEDGTVIKMEKGSTVNRNVAYTGGGFYFNQAKFTLKSEDGTGEVAENTAKTDRFDYLYTGKSGGGIHADSCDHEDGALIEGVNIKDNYSAYDGGGIELDQKGVTIRNCTITGNRAARDGGGIFVFSKYNLIDGCTITGNCCATGGNDDEGGGVFVSYHYDIKLAGMCIIKGNTRVKSGGSPDDVFLSTLSGGGGKAYIEGTLKKGSSVGVRTGIENADRRIAAGFNPESKDCLFIDLDGYYVSYGTDEGGDAWQRYRTLEFAVNLNGAAKGRYRYGSTVTVNGAGDAKKAFKCWNADISTGTTGLYPVEDYLPKKSLKDPVLTFSMPQNDVNLVAEYVDRVDAVTLSVAAPVPGTDLPATGDLTWGSNGSWNGVPVTWLVKSGDAWVPASGKAEYGSSYKVALAVNGETALNDHDLAFALSPSKSSYQVKVGGNALTTEIASVDASGNLTLEAGEVSIPRPAVAKVERLATTVKAGTDASAFRAMVPTSVGAQTNAGTSLNLAVSTGSANADLSELIEDGTVKQGLVGKTVTVRFPVKCADGSVTVPDDTMVEVAVTVTEEDVPAKPETPTVTPAAGTYLTSDKSKFINGKLELRISAQSGTQINYSVRRYSEEKGSWEVYASGTDPVGGQVMLGKADGAVARYEVEVWSVVSSTGGKTAASDHAWLAYTIDDVQPATTHTVTVKQTDTGKHSGDSTGESKIGEYAVEDGEPFSMVAPVREGYAFEKWTDESGKTLNDGSATLSIASVTADATVKAVYNPVVSALSVTLDLPQEHKALADKATKLEAKIAGSNTFTDVSSYFDDLKIEWSPEAEEGGKAGHDRTYVGKISLNSTASDGVKYVLAPDAEVLYDRKDVGLDAYVLEDGGKTSLCVVCPTTGPLTHPSKARLSDVKLSFEDAAAAQKLQDTGDLTGWGLPVTVKVTYGCGESEDYEITWNKVDGFDATATGEQDLTAMGTITFPEYVENSDEDGNLVSNEVTVKIKVAAPKKEEGKDDGKDDSDKDSDKGDSDKKEDASDKQDGQEESADKQNGDSTDGDKNGIVAKTTKVITTTKSASNKELAATGDRTPLIVGLLVVLGILIAAAGIITKRRKK